MALVKYTAVKLLHKSNVWIPTDTSESVVPLLAPYIYIPNSGTNVAEMLAFTLIKGQFTSEDSNAELTIDSPRNNYDCVTKNQIWQSQKQRWSSSAIAHHS